MDFGSLFSGIGGMDLGLEWAGMTCKWQNDTDDYCLEVLNKIWPDVPKYGDVRDVGRHNLAPVDLIAGGFPCQPYSVAGKRLGKEDPRWLWPEMARIIGEMRPSWVVAENPSGISAILDSIIDDLEAIDYKAIPIEVPAAAFGAWHLRYRTFIIAHTDGQRQPNGQRRAGQTKSMGREIASANIDDLRELQPQRIKQTKRERIGYDCWEVEPNLVRVVHGISRRMDKLTRKRVAALGNAVVPQVAEWIGRRIIEHDRSST